MEFIRDILAIIAAIVLYRFLKIAFYRVVLLVKLKLLSHEFKSIKMRVVLPFWILSWNKNTKPSFIVETIDSIYAIKLCGAFSKRTSFIFVNNSVWRKRVYTIMGRGSDFEDYIIEQSHLVIDSKVKASFKKLNIVYLFSPNALYYGILDVKNIRLVDYGADIFGGFLYDTKSFISLLKNEERSRYTNVF